MKDIKTMNLIKFSFEVLVSQLIEETTCLEYSPHEINHQGPAYLEIKRRLARGYEAGLCEGYAMGFNEGCEACNEESSRAEEALEMYYQNLSPNSDSIHEDEIPF